jgi:hypothetical protein
VAELVDARDLKSLSYGYAGSIPAARTMLQWSRILHSVVCPATIEHHVVNTPVAASTDCGAVRWRDTGR